MYRKARTRKKNVITRRNVNTTFEKNAATSIAILFHFASVIFRLSLFKQYLHFWVLSSCVLAADAPRAVSIHG